MTEQLPAQGLAQAPTSARPLDSPSRPLMGNRPCYCTPDGRRIAVIPAIQFTPQVRTSGFGAEVSVMLATELNSFRWFTTWIPESQFAVLLAEWYADPEGTMREVFGWKGLQAAKPGANAPAPAVTVARKSAPISLADLGL